MEDLDNIWTMLMSCTIAYFKGTDMVAKRGAGPSVVWIQVQRSHFAAPFATLHLIF